MTTVPLYSHKERLLIAPTLESGVFQSHVRVEAHTSIDVLNGMSDHSTAITSSQSLLELLETYEALRVTIQVRNVASQSFPSNPLEQIQPLDSLLPGTVTGPSGVSVTAQFLNSDNDNSEARFLSLLCELVGRRMLAAPLVTLNKRRLYRHVQQQQYQDDSGIQVTRMTIVLPMEGSPFAVEGLRTLTNALSPCENDSGLLAVADATAWSNLLLGVATTAPQLSSTRARGFWLSFQSSPSCHFSTLVNRNGDTASTNCTLDVSHGVHYSVSSVKANVLLSDLLPGNATELRRCALSNPMSVDTILTHEALAAGISFTPACRSWDDTTSSLLGHVASAPLGTTARTDLTLPCLTRMDDTALAVKPISTSDFWHTNLHVFRSTGVANGGTLHATVRNDHPSCGAEVSFVQTLPAVLHPRWQSLTVHSSNTSSAGGADDNLQWTDLLENNVAYKSDESVVLQFRHRLPPASSLGISLEYYPAFLSIERIPGDANRGIELPPVHAHFRSDCLPALSAQLYSQSVLLLVPLPDSSMPFNVLSLSCTLFAFVMGSMMNVLVRRGSCSVKFELDPESKPVGKLDKFKAKVRHVKERLRRRVNK
jgi:phosphatidylinositol glycan class T